MKFAIASEKDALIVLTENPGGVVLLRWRDGKNITAWRKGLNGLAAIRLMITFDKPCKKAQNRKNQFQY